MSYWIKIDKYECIDLDKVCSIRRYTGDAELPSITYRTVGDKILTQYFENDQAMDDWFEGLQLLLNVNKMGKSNDKE